MKTVSIWRRGKFELKPRFFIILAGLALIGAYFAASHYGCIPAKARTDTSVPVIDSRNSVPGTKSIRLAHWTWNAHQAWALANKGKNGATDSILAKRGISVQFNRIEDIPNQIAALKSFAEEFESGNGNPHGGVHFITIMGDAGGMVMHDVDQALRDVNSSFRGEVIGVSGFSYGEDKFMGPPEWKTDPKKSLGGVVAGVPADGDWNIMIFWCAQNQIPFNSDPHYYDPQALNFLPSDSYVQAGELYNANQPVERIFKADGVDYQGNPVKKDSKGFVAINGVVTWTPGDKNIAEGRGGVVSIVSTKEYSNQMPQYIIGLKQWDEANKDTVANLLAGIFTASDLINESDRALIAGKISPKSSEDYRWQAAVYSQQIFDSETADFWYTNFKSNMITDSRGLQVEIGGSAVSNLQRNLKFFGMDGEKSIAESVYNRFAKLAKQYYPDHISEYPAWAQVFNPIYLQEIQRKEPELAQTDPNLPVFTSASYSTSQIGNLVYHLNFDSGRASFQGGSESVLNEALDQLTIAGNSRVEIHGYTDSMGDPQSNLILSRQRSDAVYQWLRSKAGSAFPANRVSVYGHGESDAMAPDMIDGRFVSENAAQNRRVVIKIFKRQGS